MVLIRERRRLFIVFGLAGSVVLGGCADTRGGTIPYDKVLSAPDETRFDTLPSDYRIAPMDKLAIKVFKMDDLSGDYDVDLAGNISLPLVGQIKAANLTTAQLDDELTKTLGAKYLEHPDISVAIRASTAHVVTVDGAVKEGGAFAVGGPGIFGTLPRQARASYDLMIIDGPPSLGLADAPLLAAAAGNTLFVVESGKTRTRAAIEALNRLQATGTRVLGAALTKSEEGSAAYGRYGYYGYDYANTRLKRTEILMIPQSGDAQQSTAPAESDA